MKRRSSAGGKTPAKPRVPKRSTRKRRNALKATRDRGVSIAGRETVVARLTRERDEALLRETANSEILHLISRSPGDLELVFRSILENATRICEAKSGNLYGFDGKAFYLRADLGTPPAFAEFARQPRIWGRDTALGQITRTKQTVHIVDALADRATANRDPGRMMVVNTAGSRTILAVPMLRENELIGAFIIFRQVVRPFTEKQIDLVTNFAAQAVIAIENTRLLNELRQSLEQQTATSEILSSMSGSMMDTKPVFDAIVCNLLRLFGTGYATVQLLKDGMIHLAALDGETGFEGLAAHFPRPLDDSTTIGRAIRLKQVVQFAPMIGNPSAPPASERFAREYKFNSMISAPMMRGDEVIGGIVTARRDPTAFDDKQIALIKSFAAQAVIAIENTRLLNELRESLERQTATADILRVIAGTPEDSKRALDTIAETASRMFGVANVNFRRIEGDVLRVVSSAGPTIERFRKALPDIPLELTDPAVRCFLDNRQIPVEDRQATLTDERGPIAAALRELPVRSQVFTPLSREGKAIGVMIVTRGEVQPFQQSDLELMKGFADQAVIAIENARLVGELRDSYRLVQQQASKLEAQSQELVALNQQLEQRVADQVGEIERMGRLRRFLPPQVADLIVASGTEKQLESHRREITALFCDLRGFTGFSESSDPEDVMALLRDYHAAIGKIIIKYSGTLERYAGDGVMVIFNDPVPVENPALQAVLMALDMRTAIEALMQKWRLLGHDIGFGIGIAHGYATLGTIGFESRYDYAAIGTVSNVASRLCDEAKPGQILISPRVLLAVDKAVTVESVGEFALKGIRRPMITYNVLEALRSKPG
jgi:class 3 adenylate cyclase